MKCPQCLKVMRAEIYHAKHDESVLISLWCTNQYENCNLEGNFIISVENITPWLMSDTNNRMRERNTTVEVKA